MIGNVSQFAFDEDEANRDKSEWLKAKKMSADMSPEQIHAWVTCTQEGAFKDSMRAKLNHFRKAENDRKNAKRNKR